MFLRISWRAWLTAALSASALVAVGCAGLRLPRIDPSGERIFLRQPNPVPVASPATTNVQAPPVFTDAVFPPPTLPTGPTAAGLLPPIPQDKLTITPGRVLAPVGSEVILKAGLCTRENFLLTDAQVDWLLARDEVGEFVSLGGRGWLRDPWLPWNKPKKIDNQYATGYTAKVPLLITRGTADPSDDVQIEPGEAWASITSPVEGTSRITAVAPEIETWANRRATATIYWVDVQWTFPPPAVTATGGSQVLTTTVLRQTDGTPLAGWLVRYEVAAGGGALRGSDSGQVVEVPTDSQGRASIEVTPTGSAGSTTQIKTQIVRPERYANSNAPRLVIANGVSTLQWTDGGSDYVPPPDDLGAPLPPTPVVPDNNVGGTPTPALRGPLLELKVFTDDQQVEVGRQARFRVELVNSGDSPATGIVLNDRFDQGLAHPRDPNRYQEIKKTVSDIPAGASYTEFLTFGVQQAGQLCQRITVTYDGGGSAEKQACIQAMQPRVQPQGRLEVRKRGPQQRNVGETAMFTTSIKNVGDAPLTNIEVSDEYDRELLPQPVPPDARRLGDSLFWKIDRLGVGETWERQVTCLCSAPKNEACSIVSVTADTGATTGAQSLADRTCIKILPGRDVVPGAVPPPGGDVVPEVGPPVGGGAAAIPGATGGLRMELAPVSQTVLAGTRTTIRLVISNRAAVSDKQVRLRLLFPAELTPDEAAIQSTGSVPTQFNRQTGELLFAAIQEIRPNERLEFVMPCNVNQSGVREIKAELFSQNMPQAISQTKPIEILAR